jgi:hypothetical protein
MAAPDPVNNQASHNGWLVRTAKFASIIIVLALLFGGVFAIFDYVRQFTGNERWKRDESSQDVQQDTFPMLRQRFFIGAGVGLVLGLIYAGRCMIRKQEP